MKPEIKLTFNEWIKKQLTQDQVDEQMDEHLAKLKYHLIVQERLKKKNGKSNR